MRKVLLFAVAVLMVGCSTCQRCHAGCNDTEPIVVPGDSIILRFSPCGEETIAPDSFDVRIETRKNETEFNAPALSDSQGLYIRLKDYWKLERGENLISYRAKSSKPNTLPGAEDVVSIHFVPPPPPAITIGRYTVTGVEVD